MINLLWVLMVRVNHAHLVDFGCYGKNFMPRFDLSVSIYLPLVLKVFAIIQTRYESCRF